VEHGSPFEGESQPGQVPLHRIGQGLMPPPLIKSRLGGFMRLSRVILAEKPVGSMPAHTKGHEGNILVGTHI
jgi:hypothetical protein